MNRSVLSLIIFGLLSLPALSLSAHAGFYIEAGTSMGTLSNGQSFFGQSDAASTKSGFLGSLSLYKPITSERNFFHFELGIQNRVLTTSGSTLGSPLAMGSSEFGTRLQISRFYVGGGYTPFTYVSKPGDGITSLHLNGGTSAYFFEAGLIWRVIPELQIVAAYSREYGLPSQGGVSPAPVAEYGLRFRFPINPTESERGSGVQFDGFRYPFGFMK